MSNYELKDVLARISKITNKPELSAIRELTVGVIGTCNPVAGVIAGTINSVISDYNTYKFTLLLKGISTGLNVETRMNELYNYINESDENAINVANIFKKAINAESPKVCLLYGLLIAEHLDGSNSFTQEELIVCKALENGTDYDLSIFRDIMEQYVKDEEPERKSIVLPSSIENRESYITTCDWCVYNRIFVMENVKCDNSTLIYDRFYYVSAPAYILLKYINDLNRVWDYQRK